MKQLHLCIKCKESHPKDDMSIHQESTCWRCCTHPVQRIETKQQPRLQGSKL